VNGANSNLLSLTAVTTNNIGDYRVIVTNPYGSVTSQVAALVVDGVGAGGFEADVMPPPYGNNSVSVTDWVRLGRLVVGIEAVSSSSEFQRSDCAPRTNAVLGTLPLGDGRLTVADWTQAGRYAAGLDPLTPAGGTNQPAGGGAGLMQGPVAQSADAALRQLRVVGVKAALGQTFRVAIELVAAGDENGVGFSLNFDPARLAYDGVSLGEGVADGTLQVNATQAGQGRIGVVLVKPAGANFASGATVLAQVRFTALGQTGSTPISLGDWPVVREVASVGAEVRRADYLDGNIGVILPARLSSPVNLTSGGIEFNLGGQPGELYRVEVSTDLMHWEWLFTQPAGSGPITLRDPAAGPFKQRFYRAVPQP